ncbi:MAG: hypothetical protein QOD06_3456 [Candidatus Binatota bacterium]|nr:hypothetical protein [Candidatus Binatota bacterium]
MPGPGVARGGDAGAGAAAPEAVTVFRWDLDKTYLRTDFDSVRDLLRVPFETAAQKIHVPGVAELLRALRRGNPSRPRKALVYFLTASPPQIAGPIRDKFALDGVEVDGIVFKNQLQILMRGNFRGLREQVGFKLTELLRARIEAPEGVHEYLFGDDWESDAILYSLYADVVRGAVDPGELERLLALLAVDREWRRGIAALAEKLTPGDVVRRIFIHLERESPLGGFRAFGRRLVAAFNYFQTAVCLYEEAEIDLDGVEAVARALITREGYTRAMLENSLDDVRRRGHVGEETHRRLTRDLAERGLVPWRRRSLVRRMREGIGRWRVARRGSASGDAVSALDYAAVIAAWKESR